MTESQSSPLPRQRALYFPWLSIATGLLVIAVILVGRDPLLQSLVGLPDWLVQPNAGWVLALVFCVVGLVDVRLFYRRKQAWLQHIDALKQECERLWQNNKQLSQRAHTYSGHADKLKLFISDKLLEYIEYDEKYLHFKNIAAEVRHNGVICYDKVQTALQRVVHDDAIVLDENVTDLQREALAAMTYLWDLLDLSTTDNIALHISNRLCEFEERYYQHVLNPEQERVASQLLTFSPQQAAIKALKPLMESSVPTLMADSPDTLVLEDDHFRVELVETGEMLGNENHLILLLENLLKNAQFYANKKEYRNQLHRIHMSLDQHEGGIYISIYNHGPPIREEDKEKIFQLGFTTRRTKEHHGKGLGLYFVHQIVRGYEGQISFHNIDNQTDVLTVRMQTESGTVQTEVMRLELQEGKPVCVQGGDSETEARFEKTLHWWFSKPLASIEVATQSAHQPQVFSGDTRERTVIWMDPFHRFAPRWCLEVKPVKKQYRVTLIPIDVRGVRFSVVLPSAETRLEGGELEYEQGIEAEMERLNERFKGFD